MENSKPLSLSEIKTRVISSFANLIARQVALRAISFVTLNIVLAKALPVATLGIFNIAASVVTFFAFFSDIGLAASLIQKKESISHEDIKTVFTIQQALVLTLSLIIILGAPFIGTFYGLNNDGVWLVRALGFSFFLSSLKVVPSVLLERELKFQPLVIVEVTETLIFNTLLVFFVFRGAGVQSFTFATLARGVVGTSLLYILAPAPVGIGIHKEAARKLLTFGIPYQLNSLLSLLKDRLVPLVVARMIGTVGVGYVTWSQNMAFLPLEIMNIVIRITFPAFSRLQEDKESLTKAVEKSLFVTALLVYPAIFGIGAVLPGMVTYIVSSKWQPAIPSFYLFAVSTYWAVISTTFTNTLSAIGYIKTNLKLMVFWTVLTWALTPVLVNYYGFIGVGISSFIISFTSVITIILVKRVLAIKILDAVLLPTVASVVMGMVVYFVTMNFVRNSLELGLAIGLGVVLYIGFVLALGYKKIVQDIKTLRYA